MDWVQCTPEAFMDSKREIQAVICEWQSHKAILNKFSVMICMCTNFASSVDIKSN